jgi:hypothetical protein
MEFELHQTYKFRDAGTKKTTDRTITRIEDGMIYWTVPGSKAEFMGNVEWFSEQFDECGVKEG